ncbi:MAG: radical SAM protein [Desulfobacula sp.]|nr:radical SAM protein [Desulfobacula sp.]
METWKVIVFGGGQAGINMLERIKPYVICVADNDTAKQGVPLLGIPIISATQIADYEFDAILIASICEAEIKDQLIKMGYGDKIISNGHTCPSALEKNVKAVQFFLDLNKPILRTMHLNLTSACNINCRICRPPNNKKPQYLSKKMIENIVEDVFDDLTHLRLDSAGELTLSSHLEYVLNEAKKRNISVFISTNGTLIDEKMAELFVSSSAEHIQVSLDSADKETNEWIRNGAKHEDILQGVKNLVTAKKKFGKESLRIDFHGAILQQNIHHLKDIVHLAHTIGINGVSFAYGYIGAHMESDWSIFFDRVLSNEKVFQAQAYAKKIDLLFNAPIPFFQTERTIPDDKYCPYLFNWTYINPDGGVSPCCTGTEFLAGNIKSEKMSNIWLNERYQKLRETYKTAKPVYDKCSRCYLLTGWDVDDYKVHFHPNHWPEVEKRLEHLS